MGNVLKLIEDSAAAIETVDFSDNKLATLDYFTTFVQNPNLLASVKSLILSNNRIGDFRELEKLKGSKIVSLALENNSLATKPNFEERVRKILPKVKKNTCSTKKIILITKYFQQIRILNKQELPKLVTFDTADDDGESEVNLLPTQKLVSVDPNVQNLVLKFVQDYIAIFDSDDRSGLVNAYHPEAMFSMGASYIPGSTAHGTMSLKVYQADARNLMLIKKPTKRLNYMQVGNANVVKFLSDLPKTQHDLNSFTLDIPFANSSVLIAFTVAGGKTNLTQIISFNFKSLIFFSVFKERAYHHGDRPPLRHFNRSVSLVPYGSGFCIVNENLFISNTTPKQIKVRFRRRKNS